MKKVCIVALATMLIVLCAASMASAGWADNFEYANQAALNANWVTSGTALTWVTDKSTSPTHSLYQSTTAAQSRRAIGADVGFTTLDFSFKFYDGGAALGRTWGSVYSYAGAWGGSLNNIVAIGKNNGTVTTKYTGRLVNGSGSGYFNLDLAPNRSVGWHTAQILGHADGTVDWIIDGVVGATKTPGRTDQFNWVALGSNLSSSTAMWYDDVAINPVPEPGTIVAAMALLAPVGLVIRRRRA